MDAYTSHCIVEAMHVHASNPKLTEAGSAKFFVKSNGETTVDDLNMEDEFDDTARKIKVLGRKKVE